MRRLAFALACLMGLGGPLAGQQTQPTQPMFRSGVALASVDVVVLDKNDKPVPGLTAGDFEVKLNGKVQPVRALTYVQAAGTEEAVVDATPESLGRAIATNAPRRGEQRTFVVMVDDLSISAMNGKSMFYSAQRFVDKLPASDLVGFTMSSTNAGAVNPTPDRNVIRAALKHAVGDYMDPRTVDPDSPVVGIWEALEIDLGNNSILRDVLARACGVKPTQRPDLAVADSYCAQQVTNAARRVAALTKMTTARQMLALEAVIKAMAKATGIKHLVLLTEGLGVTRDLHSPRAHRQGGRSRGCPTEHSFEESDMNMNDTETGAGVHRVDDRTLGWGMQTVADMAGGNFYHVIGQADRLFDRVATAASALYRLGIDEPAGAVPGKDFTVSARVRQPGLTVHANRTAISTKPAPESPAIPIDDQLRAAIGNGSARYSVPISVGIALRRGSASSPIDLAVNVMIPASVTGPVTTMFGLVDASGTMKSGRKVVASPADGSAYRLAFSLPVSQGLYKLRVAAADATGAVGSLETVVPTRLATMGPFEVSDLFTSWTGTDGTPQFLGIEDVPAGVKTISAMIELYPTSSTTATADVHVKFGLYASNHPQALAEMDVLPTRATGFLRAEAPFSIDALEPGNYLLRATVFLAGKELGTARVSLRKR